MRNKLIFRVLGALASALIIASVFIPFVSVTGYSQSLWQNHSAVGTIYLPIMIIVFGAVGVFVFSTGFKTELAYASAGGLLFFLIMQTIPIIDQNLFNTLGVGYYCLVIGTFFIILIAFICSLRVKQNVAKEKTKKEVSVLEKIDNLYSGQPVNNMVNENNSLENIVQPIPSVVPISMPIENNSIEPQGIRSSDLNFKEKEPETIPIQTENTSVQVNPVLSEFSMPAIDTSNKIIESVINPVVSEFSVPIINTSDKTIESPINPIVSEFSVPIVNYSNDNIWYKFQ